MFPKYCLFFVSPEGLRFNWSTQKGSFIMSGQPLCEILVDPNGVCDGPAHLAWCLTFLREEGRLPEGTKRLKRLGSRTDPLDLEQLAYEGACAGQMTVAAVLEDGTEVTATKEVAYY